MSRGHLFTHARTPARTHDTLQGECRPRARESESGVLRCPARCVDRANLRTGRALSLSLSLSLFAVHRARDALLVRNALIRALRTLCGHAFVYGDEPVY